MLLPTTARATDSETRDMTSLFGGAYAGRRVLVTGHTGFKGSWLVPWLRAMGAQVVGLSLPPLTSPSHHQLLGTTSNSPVVDICNLQHVREAMLAFEPEIVFHLAAQSLVRRSYLQPVTTFDVNVLGLINVLEAVRATGSVRALVNVTTDKCYRQSHTREPFNESDALGGHDPYSASKACAEIVSDSYRASYFSGSAPEQRHVAMATARAGNVIGGGDWSEDRLIPDIVRAASRGRLATVRNPDSVRPWQHVLEPLSGYLVLGQQLLRSREVASRFCEPWNFGPDVEGHLSVGGLVTSFSKHWPVAHVQTSSDANPHEAAVLRLDCSKAHTRLCWRPVWDALTMLERTAEWYRAYYQNGFINTERDIASYVADAHNAGLRWAEQYAC